MNTVTLFISKRDFLKSFLKVIGYSESPLMLTLMAVPEGVTVNGPVSTSVCLMMSGNHTNNVDATIRKWTELMFPLLYPSRRIMTDDVGYRGFAAFSAGRRFRTTSTRPPATRRTTHTW